MRSVQRRQQTIETVAELYNGKLRLERRNGNWTLHARTYLQGKTIGKSTGEMTLGAVTRVATDWYLEQRDRIRNGERLHSPLFSDLAEAFLTHVDRQAEVSTGQRENHRDKWTLLRPFFEQVNVADVDARRAHLHADAAIDAVTKSGGRRVGFDGNSDVETSG